jgi:hypothetical protein
MLQLPGFEGLDNSRLSLYAQWLTSSNATWGQLRRPIGAFQPNVRVALLARSNLSRRLEPPISVGQVSVRSPRGILL